MSTRPAGSPPGAGVPGGDRPARGCDLDHTIPWDQHGRTCECNLVSPR